MAEWGQGDDRWIVENRQDGQNVNQWHWSEKDCLGWCRQRFAELFSEVTLVDGTSGVTARVTGVDKVTGEAILNVRKKKLIPSYELAVELAFSAEVQQAGGAAETVTGKVVLPYIAEENADEEPEVQVRPDREGGAAATAKDAIFGNRREAIFPRVNTLVEEFHAGKPAGHEPAPADASKSSKPVVKDHSGGKHGGQAVEAAAKSGAGAQGGAGGGGQRAGGKIELVEKFYASGNDLFQCFTDARRVQAFTQSPATVSVDAGGAFSMFGGSIEGKQVELVPGKRIVQDWRFNTWPEGVHSKVVLDIDESEPGHTTVTLTQTGIPEEDAYGNHNVLGTTENGWKQLIFYKIRAVFGYGL